MYVERGDDACEKRFGDSIMLEFDDADIVEIVTWHRNVVTKDGGLQLK